MLVIGGPERVYEINRKLRKESINLTLNPEFSAWEFYAAYLDQPEIMNMTENAV